MTEPGGSESAGAESHDAGGAQVPPDAGEGRPQAPPQDAGELTRFRSRAFFTTDYAVVENGKVYASGAFWSVLRFPVFPAVLPTMALVAVISVPFHANFAEHKLTVTLVDSDGNAAGVRVEGLFRSAPTIESKFGAPGMTSVAFPIQGLTIERPGEYTFALAVDEAVLDRYTFNVIQVANIPVPQAPNPPAE